MTDATPTSTLPATPAIPANLTTTQIQSALQPLADDAVQLEKEVVAIIHAYKAGGPSAAAALLPALAPELKKDYDDARADLPIIKAGYRTTEFWIVAPVILFIGVLACFGKVPAIDASEVIGAMASVYAVVRGLLKKTVATA